MADVETAASGFHVVMVLWGRGVTKRGLCGGCYAGEAAPEQADLEMSWCCANCSLVNSDWFDFGLYEVSSWLLHWGGGPGAGVLCIWSACIVWVASRLACVVCLTMFPS